MATVASVNGTHPPARSHPSQAQAVPSRSASGSHQNGGGQDGAVAGPPPPPPVTASASTRTAKGKAKKGSTPAPGPPEEAHKALLSKISQLEASTSEDASFTAEVEADARKANRDIVQLLNTLGPEKNRLEALHKKYNELFHDMKRMEREYSKAKKRGDQLQKEKEEINKDRSKERSLKEKLEKLSRELTRENKKLKDDFRDLKENSAHRNDELHDHLQSMVEDVDAVISQSRGGEISEPAEEVEHDRMFREKFTSFLIQYEMRELHFQSQMRVKELELAQQMARHEQLRKAQETELSKSHQLTRQVSTFSQTENELRGQLNVYVEKFKQVEDTLNNSNDLFLTFRKEMEEMSKKTKRLEKENLILTRKQETTSKNILAMAEERERNAKSMDRLQKENEKLKRLCRAMQEGGYGPKGGMVPAQSGNHPQHAAQQQHGHPHAHPHQGHHHGHPHQGHHHHHGHHGHHPQSHAHHPGGVVHGDGIEATLGETESEYDEEEEEDDDEMYDEEDDMDDDLLDEEEEDSEGEYDDEDTEEDDGLDLNASMMRMHNQLVASRSAPMMVGGGGPSSAMSGQSVAGAANAVHEAAAGAVQRGSGSLPTFGPVPPPPPPPPPPLDAKEKPAYVLGGTHPGLSQQLLQQQMGSGMQQKSAQPNGVVNGNAKARGPVPLVVNGTGNAQAGGQGGTAGGQVGKGKR